MGLMRMLGSCLLVLSLANSIKKLGYEFEWIKDASDFDKADVSLPFGTKKFWTRVYVQDRYVALRGLGLPDY